MSLLIIMLPITWSIADVLKFLLSLCDCHEHNQDASFHFVYVSYLVVDQELFSFYLFVRIGISISPCCYGDLLVNCTTHFFLEWVSCAVQLKCHVGNISQFWWNCTKWWLEFPKSPSSSAGNLVQHFISLCKMSHHYDHKWHFILVELHKRLIPK